MSRRRYSLRPDAMLLLYIELFERSSCSGVKLRLSVSAALARASADLDKVSRRQYIQRRRRPPAPVCLPTLSLPPALSATGRMATEHSVNDIQEQLEALFKLVDDQPGHKDPYPKPTVTEGSKILAVKKDWLKSICCLNLIMTHKFVDRVWQSLQQRLDTLKTALNDGRALRFDVMVLGIASHRTLCPVRVREGCRADLPLSRYR